MSGVVTFSVHGSVALITIDNAPVNALSQAIRRQLLTAVTQADQDPGVTAIVLHGAGRNFCAGADIRELERPRGDPLLDVVLQRLEDCRKPTIAALHGAVMGGGFETALASSYRCATRDITLGLPEVKLGLPPGAGGTWRLPRAIGLKAALDMMVSGDPIRLDRARELGLIDLVVDGTDVLAPAIEFAQRLTAAGAVPRRWSCHAECPGAPADFFTRYRASLPRAARKLEVVERIIQCVEATSAHPAVDQSQVTSELFEESRQSAQSRALRYLFFAERDRARGRPVDGTSRPRTTHIGVVGAGTMGAGIAASCLCGGFRVTLVDSQSEALERGQERIHSIVSGLRSKGGLTAEEAQDAHNALRVSTDLMDVREADLVIEAIVESMDAKQRLFRQLDEICQPGAVLATNTSSLDVSMLAEVTRRPASVLGMHFFSPAHVMRLIEVVRGRLTSEATIAAALSVAKRLSKIAVVVGNCFGFVGNRMLYCYGRESQLMMLEGVEPERIDRVLEDFGMAMGPAAVGDLAGLDVGYRVRRERRDPPDDPCYYRVADMLVEQGRYGQKTGKGFYIYESGSRARRPDPVVRALIRAEAERLGVRQRDISDDEIVERCIYALVNEGARILQEGIAGSPSDIDVIWCNAYGFPRTRGGPMFFADAVGTAKVCEAIRRFESTRSARYWEPAPLLLQLASRDLSFAGWHAARAASAG